MLSSAISAQVMAFKEGVANAVLNRPRVCFASAMAMEQNALVVVVFQNLYLYHIVVFGRTKVVGRCYMRKFS